MKHSEKTQYSIANDIFKEGVKKNTQNIENNGSSEDDSSDNEKEIEYDETEVS